MGLLKTVFEVNLGLFLKDRRCVFIRYFFRVDGILIFF